MAEGPRLPADFAARVRAARAYAGISTQAEFGRKTGVHEKTIGNYEGGKSKPGRMAAPETVKAFAKVSKLPEWFFTIPRLSRTLAPADASALGAMQDSIDQIDAAVTALLVAVAEQDTEPAHRLLDEGNRRARG